MDSMQFVFSVKATVHKLVFIDLFVICIKTIQFLILMYKKLWAATTAFVAFQLKLIPPDQVC